MHKSQGQVRQRPPLVQGLAGSRAAARHTCRHASRTALLAARELHSSSSALQELVRYWLEDYSWSKQQRWLNTHLQRYMLEAGALLQER